MADECKQSTGKKNSKDKDVKISHAKRWLEILILRRGSLIDSSE